MEIGPLDVNLKPRPINWVQAANILFIDNPVGMETLLSATFFGIFWGFNLWSPC